MLRLVAPLKRARDTVSALVHRIGGETAHSTAAVGLIGAYTTVQELAVFTQDPYLTVLATALGQLRFGQVHPWLSPPKVSVHPKESASEVLGLRAIPIAVIEYLVRSGLCRSKTEATSDVLNSIGITENTLKGWRRQQRLLRAAQFDLELRTIAIVAAEVKKARERVKTTPELRLCIEKNDLHFGLCALDAVRDRLKELDAHRGQPTGFEERGG